MNIAVLTHYGEDDKKFISDYYSIEILNEDGKSIYFKGDNYHDKGAERIEGFIDGLKYGLNEEIKIEYINIADGVC